MDYFFSKIVSSSFDKTITKITSELKNEGLIKHTKIDVKEAIKMKLDLDFRPYKILGACNPSFDHKVLLAENNLIDNGFKLKYKIWNSYEMF